MSIAQQELDYTTLKWVKDEIRESLNQTRQALEAYVENPNDTTQIRFCATYLHQIYGTLQMVEIYGGALLAEEMELLANAISQGKVSRKEDAYEVLMRAILQLPAYLEHLENGQQDMPVILLPLLNDLRTARGEHLLSENAFFSPNLTITPPQEEAKKPSKPVDIQQYAKKLRPVYQAALVRWYRNLSTTEPLQKMAIVIRELLYNSTTESAMRLWWVASGMVEGLLDNGLEPSNSVKQLMGHQIDRQIKRIIDQGEQAFNKNPPVELLKNLLYYVATSTSQGARTGQIKMAFNLEQLLPGSVDVNEAFAQLRGSKTDLMQSVSAVIKEDLLHVKDQLDIFVRTKNKPVTELESLRSHLHRISDTLAMLGLGDLHKIIQDQNRSIAEIVKSGSQPSEFSLMEVASALLYVESSLEGLQSTVTSSVLGSHEKADTLLPPSEQRQLNNLVIAEANKLVSEVKEAFNAYAIDTTNRAAIESTPGKLDEIRGVLAILELNRAANLLNAAVDYIRHQLLREDVEPNQKALDLLADVITSIEYFLEAVAENRGHPENILRVAEASAQELGYTPEAIREIQKNRAASGEKPWTLVADEAAPASASKSAPQAAAKSRAGDSLALAQTARLMLPEADEIIRTPAAKPAPAKVAAPAVAAAAKIPKDDIDEEILEIFLEEADEVVGTIQENLRAWKKNQSNSEALTVLRRSYHTIKGSGRLAGAKVVGEFAWSIENMLNRVIEGRLEVQPAIFELLENAESTLRNCIQHLKGELETQPNVHAIVVLADALANGSYAGATRPKPDLIDELLGDITAPAATGENLAEQARTPPVDVEAAGTDSPNQEFLEQTSEARSIPEDKPDAAAAALQSLSLIDIFTRETTSHLETVERYLAKYSDNEVHLVTEPLMRALHTLHGSANMAGVENVAKLSEHLDRYIATLYDSRQPVNSDTIDVLTQGAAFIKTMLRGTEYTSTAIPDTRDLVQRIHELHEAAKETAAPRDEEDLLSIVPGFNRAQNDGLEEVSEMFANWSPDGLGDMVDAGEASADGLEDTVELAIDEPEAITERIELASHEMFNALSGGGIEVEEIELSAETESESITLAASADEEEVDHELISIFLDEAEEILRNTEALIQGWSNDPNEHSIMDELQRSLHTLKGGARMANLMPIANLSHRIETLLEAIIYGSVESSADVPKAVQRCQDWLSQALESVRAGLSLKDPSELSLLIQSYIDAQPEDQVLQATQASTVAAEEITLEDALPLEEELTIAFKPQSTAPESTAANESAASETITLAEEPVSGPEVENASSFENTAFEIEERLDTLEARAEPALDSTRAAAATEYDDELVEIFLEEAEEIQENIDRLLHNWSKDISNHALIAEMQRALHTLKGGARMAGVKPVGDLSHAIESLMESVTEKRLPPTEEFPKVVHACHDWLSNAIEQVKHRQVLGSPAPLLKQLENLLAGKAALEGVSDFEKGALKATRKPAVAEAKKPQSKPKAQEKKPEPRPARIEPVIPGNLIALPGFSSKDEQDATLIQNPEDTQP
ncbi:MAG TPA: Hpt domain-containing protein, partial [Gammaproteobacteria bacterium]